MAALESEEMKEIVMGLIVEHALEAVVLEPDPTKTWMFNKEGVLTARGQHIGETEAPLAKAGARYLHCQPGEDTEGYWDCALYDKRALIKEFATPL